MTVHVYQQFTQQAIHCNLSGRQMQFWLSLYDMMAHKKQQNLQLYTPMLLKTLQISRSQFLRVRQALIDKGFLAISQNRQQQTYYTLLLQGNVVAFVEQAEEQAAKSQQQEPLSTAAIQALCEPLANPKFCLEKTQASTNVAARKIKAEPDVPQVDVPSKKSVTSSLRQTMQTFVIPAVGSSGDIMLDKRYWTPLQNFCAQYDDRMLRGMLHRWAEMREKNGWVLSTWGLQTLLEKLKIMSAENIETMIAIVKQSLHRRWKGFFPLQVESKPSGEKLRKLEEKEARLLAQQNRGKPTSVSKFKNEGRDLSFLEE